MHQEANIGVVMAAAVSERELAAAHAAIAAGLTNGTLRPVIGEQFSLADAPKVLRAVMEKSAYGKNVLIP